MTEKEFPPEVIEAAIIANVGNYAIREFRTAHVEIVKFLEDLESNGGIEIARFMVLMDNVLLTLVHGRDYIRLAAEKAVDPLIGTEGKIKYASPEDHKAIRDAVRATDDPRIARLTAIVNEDLEAYDKRKKEEEQVRTEEIAEAFQKLLRDVNKNDSASD